MMYPTYSAQHPRGDNSNGSDEHLRCSHHYRHHRTYDAGYFCMLLYVLGNLILLAPNPNHNLNTIMASWRYAPSSTRCIHIESSTLDRALRAPHS